MVVTGATGIGNSEFFYSRRSRGAIEHLLAFSQKGQRRHEIPASGSTESVVRVQSPEHSLFKCLKGAHL